MCLFPSELIESFPKLSLHYNDRTCRERRRAVDIVGCDAYFRKYIYILKFYFTVTVSPRTQFYFLFISMLLFVEATGSPCRGAEEHVTPEPWVADPRPTRFCSPRYIKKTMFCSPSKDYLVFKTEICNFKFTTTVMSLYTVIYIL